MSYRAGIFGFEHLGIPSGVPRLICDGCGLVWILPTNRPPPAWFLAKEAKPGWSTSKDGDTRKDYCSICKSKDGKS